MYADASVTKSETRAPNGAFAPCGRLPRCFWNRQKAPAPNGALRLYYCDFMVDGFMFMRQKAPSARRCIKFLRPSIGIDIDVRQKAPSAKRNVNFRKPVREVVRVCRRQKAPKAKRCIKTDDAVNRLAARRRESESTERQKVHLGLATHFGNHSAGQKAAPKVH